MISTVGISIIEMASKIHQKKKHRKVWLTKKHFHTVKIISAFYSHKKTVKITMKSFRLIIMQYTTIHALKLETKLILPGQP